MAVVSGTFGSVTNASGYASAINAWTIDVAVAEQDITSWDDASSGVIWRNRIAGIREWSGTFSGLLDAAAIASGGSDGYGLGDELSATFTIDGVAATPGTIAGTVIITGVSHNVDIANPGTISFTFVGKGAPTFTNSAAV